jgi:hypothetical protein
MTSCARPSKVDECLVTTGGIAAMDLICKVLVDPGDVVIVGETLLPGGIARHQKLPGAFCRRSIG